MDEILDERISKVIYSQNKERKNNDRIKRGKIIKEPRMLYAQVHESVMKGIWEY